MVAANRSDGRSDRRQKETLKKRATRQPKATKTTLSRSENNRCGAQKSSGPGTVVAKAESRLSALEHGITVRSSALLDGCSTEFEARRRWLHNDLNARNGLEFIMIDRMATQYWASIRGRRVEEALLSYRARHEPLEEARAAQERAIELCQLLLADPSETPRDPARGPGGHLHPARLLLALEASLPGCEMLLGRLDQLDDHIGISKVWVANDGYELVRLLGHHVGDLVNDYGVALVLLASQCVANDCRSRPSARAMTLAMCEALGQALITPEGHVEEEPGGKQGAQVRAVRLLSSLVELCDDPYGCRFTELPLERLVPTDVDEARRRLAAVIADERRRVEAIRATHVQIAAADAASAAARLEWLPGPDADRLRRATLAHEQIALQSIELFLKIRKASKDGALDSWHPADRSSPMHQPPTNPTAAIGPAVGPARQRSTATASIGELHSPTPQRATGQDQGEPSPAGTSGERAVQVTIKELVAQCLRQQTVCADDQNRKNEANAHSGGAKTAPEPVSAGALRSQSTAPAVSSQTAPVSPPSRSNPTAPASSSGVSIAGAVPAPPDSSAIASRTIANGAHATSIPSAGRTPPPATVPARSIASESSPPTGEASPRQQPGPSADGTSAIVGATSAVLVPSKSATNRRPLTFADMLPVRTTRSPRRLPTEGGAPAAPAGRSAKARPGSETIPLGASSDARNQVSPAVTAAPAVLPGLRHDTPASGASEPAGTSPASAAPRTPLARRLRLNRDGRADAAAVDCNGSRPLDHAAKVLRAHRPRWHDLSPELSRQRWEALSDENKTKLAELNKQLQNQRRGGQHDQKALREYWEFVRKHLD